jgi:hypothetical protein
MKAFSHPFEWTDNNSQPRQDGRHRKEFLFSTALLRESQTTRSLSALLLIFLRSFFLCVSLLDSSGGCHRHRKRNEFPSPSLPPASFLSQDSTRMLSFFHCQLRQERSSRLPSRSLSFCSHFSVHSGQFHILLFNSLFKVLFQFSFTVLVCYRSGSCI